MDGIHNTVCIWGAFFRLGGLFAKGLWGAFRGLDWGPPTLPHWTHGPSFAFSKSLIMQVCTRGLWLSSGMSSELSSGR